MSLTKEEIDILKTLESQSINRYTSEDTEYDLELKEDDLIPPIVSNLEDTRKRRFAYRSNRPRGRYDQRRGDYGYHARGGNYREVYRRWSRDDDHASQGYSRDSSRSKRDDYDNRPRKRYYRDYDSHRGRDQSYGYGRDNYYRN